VHSAQRYSAVLAIELLSQPLCSTLPCTAVCRARQTPRVLADDILLHRGGRTHRVLERNRTGIVAPS